MDNKNIQVSNAQWEILLHTIEKNPSLFTAYENSSQGRDRKRRLWQYLAHKLNSSGGAEKSRQEWANWFNSKKSRLKMKILKLNKFHGCPVLNEILTEKESRLAVVLGSNFGKDLYLSQTQIFPIPTEIEGSSNPKVNIPEKSEPCENVIDVDLIENSSEQDGSYFGAESPDFLSEALCAPSPKKPKKAKTSISRPKLNSKSAQTEDIQMTPENDFPHEMRLIGEGLCSGLTLIGMNLGRIASCMERITDEKMPYI